jgi:hypothetical protein
MKTETIRVVQPAPVFKFMPADLDEMTTGDFLEMLAWWAKLSSEERQAVLASSKQTRH